MDWDRITLALNLLAVDPAGLKGLWLRARAGGLRDRVTAALSAVALPGERLHPGITDDALYGGLDLAATLASGRPVMARGVLSRPALLTLTMAERVPPGLAARLAQALDGVPSGGVPCLVALDEAAEEGEGLPPCLSDRLAFLIDLDGIAFSDTADIRPDTDRIAAARTALPQLSTPPGAIAALTRAAAELGIASLRAPLLALAAARAHAAFCGRGQVEAEDLTLAAELVFGHRALPLVESAPPNAAEPPPPPPPPDDRAQDQDRPDDTSPAFPEEVLIAAARAALPADMLERLAAGRAARLARGATGTGAERGGNRRGRPLPSRPGRMGTGARIDLVATLRAAAPWQPLRRRQSARPDAVLLVRPADIRLKRFREMSDRVLVFAVDASGSSAFARLAEAKGAIELLLAQAYARRDHVALIAFRGRAAELILPPTRSLVQTKRRLQGLPGGGGTPLAAGLQMAMATAQQARARGLTPTLAVLTDGRGNIALSGEADRAQAETDALGVARAIRGLGLSGVVIDTASRPQPSLAMLAGGMGVPYLALPRADAQRLSAALGAVVGD
jgi:magnesium chelatase subunit D